MKRSGAQIEALTGLWGLALSTSCLTDGSETGGGLKIHP